MELEQKALGQQPTEQALGGRLPSDVWTLILHLVFDIQDPASCQLLSRHVLRQLIRLSTVCRSCALAAKAVMFKYHSFGVGYVESKQLRMGSKLMLQWAPCVKKLYVYRNNISQKGMKKFIGAAANLIEVELAMDIVCAADMDDLLCASSSLVTVRCRGLYIPAHLPQQLVAFLTCLEPTYIEPPRMATFVLRARFERLLMVAAGMPHLRVLDIACKGLDDLRSRVQLPDIAELTLRLRLDKAGLRLDWVGQQDCGQLNLHLEIWAWDSPHRIVMRQLEHMNISSLTLCDCVGCGWERNSNPEHAYIALAAFRHFKLDLLS